MPKREMQLLELPPGRKEPAVAPVSLHPVSTAGSRCPGAAAGSDPGRISGWERRWNRSQHPQLCWDSGPRARSGSSRGVLSSLVMGAGTLWVPPAHPVPWLSSTFTFWGA